ncbi:DinB family protein [Paludisphaera mucosa]|uniref:DinB family protein n=1 Tax=Paludisphaera mucosa TaxID=3030827 RepID=A0ABT6FBT1_9BACT|nr:DinB family protein [Paludisphaera mucosa]MDG3004961.1 DinB family protein [Paludisphaera mucosa]
MAAPKPDESMSHFGDYIALVPEDDVLPALRSELAATLASLSGLDDAEAMRRHPPYTWSIKEVVAHLIDAERVFGYRALRFARSDATPLPGFDENLYAQTSGADARPLADLLDEFEALRRSHVRFFEGLSPEAWDRRGVASDATISVRALAYVIVGHERHHATIVRRRLGPA